MDFQREDRLNENKYYKLYGNALRAWKKLQQVSLDLSDSDFDDEDEANAFYIALDSDYDDDEPREKEASGPAFIRQRVFKTLIAHITKHSLIAFTLTPFSEETKQFQLLLVQCCRNLSIKMVTFSIPSMKKSLASPIPILFLRDHPEVDSLFIRHAEFGGLSLPIHGLPSLPLKPGSSSTLVETEEEVEKFGASIFKFFKFHPERKLSQLKLMFGTLAFETVANELDECFSNWNESLTKLGLHNLSMDIKTWQVLNESVVSKLTSLKGLSLNSNCMTSRQEEVPLPDIAIIGKITSLEYLVINHNGFYSFPTLLPPPSPEATKELLRNILAFNNGKMHLLFLLFDIDQETANLVAELFDKNCRLTNLSVQTGRRDFVDLSHLLVKIGQSRTMKSLSITASLSHEKALLEMLKSNRSLKNLTIHGVAEESGPRNSWSSSVYFQDLTGRGRELDFVLILKNLSINHGILDQISLFSLPGFNTEVFTGLLSSYKVPFLIKGELFGDNMTLERNPSIIAAFTETSRNLLRAGRSMLMFGKYLPYELRESILLLLATEFTASFPLDFKISECLLDITSLGCFKPDIKTPFDAKFDHCKFLQTCWWREPLASR